MDTPSNAEREPSPPGPADALARRHLVAELLNRRRSMQARPLISAGLREDPNDVEMLYQAARAEWIDDCFTEAHERLAEVLRLEPAHEAARYLMVLALTETGELVQAEQLALELLREFPRSADLYVVYARVMLHALHVGKASSLVTEALRLAPDDADALRMRALCDMVQGARGVDGPAMQRLLSEHPDDLATLATLAAGLAHAGRHREALRCCRQLLRAEPTNPHWLQMTRELVAATHWTLWPLRPLQRYGWGASVGLWVGTVLLLRTLSLHAPQVAGPASWLLLGYVAYSWIWPPLFRKWILRN